MLASFSEQICSTCSYGQECGEVHMHRGCVWVSRVFLIAVDSSSKHHAALDEQRAEMQRLSETVRQRDAEIRAMKEADAQRAAVLQSAVNSYVARSPYSA